MSSWNYTASAAAGFQSIMPNLAFKKGVIHTGIIIVALLGLFIATAVTVSAKGLPTYRTGPFTPDQISKIVIEWGNFLRSKPPTVQTSSSVTSGRYQTVRALQKLNTQFKSEKMQRQYPALADEGRGFIEKLEDMLSLGHDHRSFLNSSERRRLAFLHDDFKRKMTKLSSE